MKRAWQWFTCMRTFVQIRVGGVGGARAYGKKMG